MRLLLLLLLVLTAGCSSAKPEPPRQQLMTPQTRLIYHGGAGGFGIYTFCDRGARVFLTETGLFQVLPNGCLDGQP